MGKGIFKVPYFGLAKYIEGKSIFLNFEPICKIGVCVKI